MTASVPDDIAVLIFEQVGRVHEAEDRWPARVYDHGAAQAPFTVAAVCQHWRRLALTTSALWTYFGFPPAGEIDKRHLQRLELLRCRVGAAPIDVIFGWDHHPGDYFAEACRQDILRSVFEAILSLHLQWKTVVLHSLECVYYGWTIDETFHSTQWPLLQSLSFAMSGVQYTVPAAPRLQRMWLERRQNVTEGPFISDGYPALTMLSIFCESWPVLQVLHVSFGRQLVDLVLVDDFDDDFLDGLESVPAIFLALQCLTLDDARWLPQINAPALKKLIISTRCIQCVEEGALRRLDHVRELQLFGAFNASQLAFFEDLSNITTLAFCYSRAFVAAIDRSRAFYRISTGALCELAGRKPSIWPQLQRLHFAPFDPKIIHHEACLDAQDLVEFVLARNTRTANQPEGHGGPTIARMVEVIANYPGKPDWLDDKLRVLIAG